MKSLARSITAVLIGLAILYPRQPDATDGAKLRFPGGHSQLASPDGRYVAVNIDSDVAGQAALLGDNHALFLLDLKTKTVEEVYPYGRGVEILWSPGGSALLINDRAGSDHSNTAIVILTPQKRRIDVEAELRAAMSSNKSIFKNHHVYISGTQWLTENKVRIKVSGYGDVDPKGFTLWYEYAIGGDFRRTN